MIKKSKYGMPPPANRAEFEHNIGLVFEEGINKFESKNKDSIANFQWAVGKDIQKLNFLPNGRINLLSINERLRLHGNSMHWMKFLPPLEIPEEYKNKKKTESNERD